MTILLDTHFLIWVILQSKRLARYPWLDRYRPWGISPVSLLEIQFLAEIGKLTVANPAFTQAVTNDPRFIIDDIGIETLVAQALAFHWTRDPFDRLIAAHSAARRVPLCTTDGVIRANYSLLVTELNRVGSERD
jgi:PIN domain nuclease of toxin-antitoxin system